MKAAGIHAIGRRKTSVARLILKPGSGLITINGKPYSDYLSRKTLDMVLLQPLVVVGMVEKFDITVKVSGGGKSGQAGAARLAIARALVKSDEKVRAELKPLKLLTRDSRRVERKKYGHHKARKRPQFSKR